VEVNIHTVSGVQQEADIRLTDEELRPHFERVYEQYRAKAELKGFRKGKAPLAIIKKLYGEAIEYDSLDDLATEFYRKAMSERDIRPIGQPSLIDMDFKRGQHLRFKIKYEVKPSIELKKYKGIAVEKPVHRVTQEEIDAEVMHLRKINSTRTGVAAVTGPDHVVTGTIQELDDAGTPLIGRKTVNVSFDLSEATLAPEIKTALAAAEVGRTYAAKVPPSRGTPARDTHIAISVDKVEKVDLPAFNEAFVTKLTNSRISTTEEFLLDLRRNLERYWEQESARKLDDAIAGEIVKLHEFAVPEAMVNMFLDAFIDDIKGRSRDRKLPPDFNEARFREENRVNAIWQAKWLLLKERIAEKESISVTDEEIETLASAEAKATGIDRDRLIQYYKDSNIAHDRLFSEKVLSFLKNNAKITERVVGPPAFR
jgi:trigger factor